MQKKRRGWLALFVLTSMATASADEGSYSWWRHDRDDEHTPAAPEPAQVLLLAGGLTLVGVYIAWRQRKQDVQVRS